MKRILIVCMLMSAMAASAATGSEPAALSLDPGPNIVRLTLVNGWNRDIDDVAVSVDRGALPAWLTVDPAGTTVDVPESGEVANLILAIDVGDAAGASGATIPLVFADAGGNTWRYDVAVTVADIRPQATILRGNFPNPFNPSTTITYDLDENAHTSLVVYAMTGQKVRTLVDGARGPGAHAVVWDGRDDAGNAVSSGVYVCRLAAGPYTKSITMVLAK